MGVLSCAKHIILGPVEDITNMFAQEEVFPTKLKEVKVVPVYKSGNESDPCNCRPTSLLSIISCIFEKMMYHGPKDVLDTNDNLFKSQCGFCEMHSTFIFLDIVNMIQKNMAQKLFPRGIFINLRD